MNIKNVLGIGMLIILFILTIIFSYSRTKHIFTGPKIVILEPENGSSFSESYFILDGKVKNTSEIILNDRALFITENGDFKENIVLNYRLNIIKLELKDKFGNIKIEYLKYYLNKEIENLPKSLDDINDDLFN